MQRQCSATMIPTLGGETILGTADVQMIKALMPLKASSSSGVVPLVTSAMDIRPSGTSMSLKALVLCTASSYLRI